MTDPSGAQRRSKTDTTAVPAADRLLEQLRQALYKMEHQAVRMETLHLQWSSYLILLSLFVLGISLYQLYVNGRHCYNDIQLWNARPTAPFTVQHATALGMILRYSVLYGMSTYMMLLLALFLQKKLVLQPHATDNTPPPLFRHAYYRFAQSSLGPILFLYCYKNMAGNNVPGRTSYEILPCIPQSWRTWISPQEEGATPFLTWTEKQPFPVTVLFFVIGSVSVYFMQQQRKQMTSSKNTILTLQAELLQKRKKAQGDGANNNALATEAKDKSA